MSKKQPSQKKVNQILTLLNKANYAKALPLTKKMIKDFPRVAFGWKILGFIYKMLNYTQEAIDAMQKATKLEPSDAEAHYNLGTLFSEQSRFEEAKNAFFEAIRLKPDYADAYSNLGTVLQSLGDIQGAKTYYLKAIELQPSSVSAYNNLGNVLKILGSLEDAKISYINAIKLDPNHYEAYNGLANVLQDLGQSEDALKFYLKSIDIKPDYYEAYSNYLFSYNYSLSFDHSYYIKFANMFGDILSANVVNRFEHKRDVSKDKRLRVGFISGDFKNHAVGFFLENMLKYISELELFAYSTNFFEDDLTQRIKTYFSKWTPIYSYDDAKAASIINDDEIDILIDLSGHSAHNKMAVLAYKPAPIQASWLGYFATTGVAEIDYFIGDRYVAPQEEDANFREKLYRLRDTWLCFTPPNYDVDVNELPLKKNNFITFGCFNNLNKINDKVIETWSEILLSLPSSKLFLKSKQLGDTLVASALTQKFKSFKVASDRLILEGVSPRDEYLKSYHKVDITLDPFPYHGGTISAESLYMGVPVLTLKGDRFLSRVGESMAHNINMDSWIAQDTKEYIEKAKEFSFDIDSLTSIRKNLRDKMKNSPLLDGKKFASNFEDAMRDMWVNN